jgi:hypothetical protein
MTAEYEACLLDAQRRYNAGKLKLCPRGYCTAKQKFAVYPSAYANGYATQVCQGSQPDAQEETVADEEYMARLHQVAPVRVPENNLQRWFHEQWVNVCESGDGPGGYQPCGSGNGVDDPANYPYCRPYYKQPGTTIVTAPELSAEELRTMCTIKRSQPQGVDGRPTRVFLEQSLAQPSDLEIPDDVREAAQQGLDLLDRGYAGGTRTGWDRGAQLAEDQMIDVASLADMRTWFARHGPDASNGGTSYPGYCKWLADGAPTTGNLKSYRGAVSWLIWGGNPAYLWLKSPQVRALLEREFPKRKRASPENNLTC